MDCPSTSRSYPHQDYPTRPQHPLFTNRVSQSPALEYPPSYHSEHEAKFNVQVRVQRSFSFEELQSGSYFESLDESDFQFYRVYGQPVLIPPPDEHDGNFIVHGAYPTVDFSCEPLQNSGLHVDQPPVFTSKSYSLQNPLGEGSTGSLSMYTAPLLAPPNCDWQCVKREPSEGATIYPNPALSAIASQLYTLPDQDDTELASVTEASGSYVDDQKPVVPVYDGPPMDSLPYPPPASAASPPYFSGPQLSQTTQDCAILRPSSSSFIHDTSFQVNAGRDHWEDASARAPRLTVPSQSYMLSELSPPVSAAFSQRHSQQYTPPSVTRSHRRHSRSPSPRSPLRLSPAPHTKRSLDKKPALACLFCRGRKIACGPPQPGSKDKTCNQCARRHLKCEYPSESRRGMRKRRSLIPRTSTATPEINPDGPRVNIVKTNRKRSVDKSC